MKELNNCLIMAAKVIKAERADMGWSLADLSRKCKVPKSTIHNMEHFDPKDPTHPRLDSFLKVLKTLNLYPERLFDTIFVKYKEINEKNIGQIRTEQALIDPQVGQDQSLADLFPPRKYENTLSYKPDGKL
jgi:transcriptional regulator with XRE-family HTH domain